MDIVKILIVSPICLSFVLMIFKPFRLEYNLLKFSKWAKLFALFTFLFLLFLILKSNIGNKGLNEKEMIWAFSILFAVGYVVYFFFNFGYEFKGNTFIWFHFFLKNSVVADEIIEIAFLEEKSAIVKVNIKTNLKEYKIRNDLKVSDMVFCFAKENKIKLITRKLG
ncbi:MAG: hypothetical protein KKF62_17970 [Bacteroidetes bacterium]|nr:hypothetical protein [Bacteroidota bacterium]MBU1115318.1 hypothetical protein [Bacteroidota bacterium]MBU1800362.1 hypothetical protein [Bacteroidota bacterium]